MNVKFKKSFLKDVARIKNKKLKEQIYIAIKNAEEAENIFKIKNIKKLIGYENYFRIKLGEYRIGIKLEGDVVFFVLFLHRKDIYKGFP